MVDLRLVSLPHIHTIRLAHDLEEFMRISKKEFLDLTDFCAFTEHYHNFLFPAFQLRMALQKAVLGTSYWETASNRRSRAGNRDYIKVRDLIRMVSILFL
jgi:hypothetical protein